MLITVCQNRKDETHRLAFAPVKTERWGKFTLPCYFSDKNNIPELDSKVEVMICGVLMHRDASGYYDFNRPPKALFIRLPTDDDIAIVYQGFECSGSMCQTLTWAQFPNGKNTLVTPGRLQSYLIVANNVGFGDKENPLIPGSGWVRYNSEKGRWRLEGVKNVADLAFVHEKPNG